jgi:helix-turn-helix protein
VEDVLNLKQAAEKLKTSERDVRDLANRGLLKFKRKNRYHWYFKETFKPLSMRVTVTTADRSESERWTR